MPNPQYVGPTEYIIEYYTDTYLTKADEPKPDSVDVSEKAVQRRVDQVCEDLVQGRTTKNQRRVLGGTVERAERVKPGSDAAVGRITSLR